MTDALAIEGLSAAYGSVTVLSDVGLSAAPGELVAVLGPSGSGKTTLLRAVAGFVPPTAGVIRVGGRDVAGVPVEQRRVGLVFQDYALFARLSVMANIGFAPGATDADVGELLEMTGLRTLAARLPSELSGGQQQRVALARALAARPDVLLLDEPFANLDPPLRARLGADLRRLVADRSCAALLVTHDRGDALALADRVAVLHEGRLVQLAPPAEVFARPASETVARIVSDGFVLEGTASGDVAETSLGTVSLLEARTGPVRLWVRPDQARFTRGEGPHTVTTSWFAPPEHRVECGEVGGTCVEAVGVGETGRVEVVAPVWALG